MTAVASIDRSQLGSLTKLGGGGQGDVYHAPKARINFAASVAFKEYKPAWRRGVDFGALEAMAAFLESRSFGEGSEIVARVAWPTKVVTDAGVPVGFLMPEVADEFRISVSLPSGKADRPLAGLQLLLNSDDFLRRRGIAITERDRYLLAAEVAEALALFHRYDIAVGDLSPKNVLFSLTPSPRCFFVDADAMRLAGRSALPQAETPDWEIRSVSGEELATPASDSYKLGILVLRLLAGDQSTSDPGSLPRSVPADIRELIVGSLVANPASRPAAVDWIARLRAAAAGASTTVAAARVTTRPQAVAPVAAQSQPSPASAQPASNLSSPQYGAPQYHQPVAAPPTTSPQFAPGWPQSGAPQSYRPGVAGTQRKSSWLGVGPLLGVVVIIAIVTGIAFVALNGHTKPTSGSFYLSAATEWADAGVAVDAGDVLTLTSSGTYGVAGSDPGKTPQSVGCASQQNSAAAAPSLSLWSVVGRVGAGEAFCIGPGSEITSTATGDLYVTINDDTYGDNWGGVTIDWQISSPNTAH